MKQLMLAALLLCGAVAARANPARPCFNDVVGVADSSGNYIHLQSGQRFRVFPGKNAPVIFWAPLDKVTVCSLGGSAYEITNLARHDAVPTLRLF